MRKILWIVGLALVFPIIASAQDVPKVEIFGGYTYTRVGNYSVPLAVISQGGGALSLPAFGLNGWTASATVNANKWLGATAEVCDVYGTPIKEINATPLVFRAHEYSYLFGPRFSYRGERWTPFFHALFGGAHAGVAADHPEEVG